MRRLHEHLGGTPHLVPSFTSEDRPTNGYAYVLRVDPEYAKTRGVSLRKMTEGIVAALGAEGVRVSIANWLLPAHAVFQAKNAYGKGSPWAQHDATDVDYDPDRFPVARRHADTHFGMTTPLRAPNGPDVARAVGQAIRKVFDHIDRIDPDQILNE